MTASDDGWDDHTMHRWFVNRRRVLPTLWIALAISAGLAQAQNRTVWDGAYADVQATRGAAQFSEHCVRCHSATDDNRSRLTGDKFWKGFGQKSVGDLLDFVRKNMPNNAGGSLSLDTYQDLVAFLLRANGFPPGTAELTAGNVTDVRIVPKEGGEKLPANALVRVIGCLARNGADWVVTTSSGPVRAEHAGKTDADATAPLGTRSMTLKFVFTDYGKMIGSRVSVTGLLIGEDGEDGLNMTTIDQVAAKCP